MMVQSRLGTKTTRDDIVSSGIAVVDGRANIPVCSRMTKITMFWSGHSTRTNWDRGMDFMIAVIHCRSKTSFGHIAVRFVVDVIALTD